MDGVDETEEMYDLPLVDDEPVTLDVSEKVIATLEKIEVLVSIAAMWGASCKRFPKTTVAITALSIGGVVGWRYYTKERS